VDLDKDGRLNGRLAEPADFGSGEHAPTFLAADSVQPPVPVKVDPTEIAYRKVVAGAGCALMRDSVDRTLIADLTSLGKRGKTISDPEEMGGFGEIKGGPAKIKNGGDGIPDAWKAAHHLDPLDPAGANGDADHDGYTNIEKFLNELAGEVVN
jgi:hypothetical protein